MNTFLPYINYQQSATVLDRRRLGKQRVEVLQILNALNNPSYGWQNHPAVRMWRGYEYQLVIYGGFICLEWIKRGYQDSCLKQITAFTPKIADTPPWLTSDFCLAHQSNLLRKEPAHYRPLFGNDIPDNLPYIWPVT